MEKTTNEPGLILASKSPRRKYLLEQAGLDFEVFPSDLDESLTPLTSPGEYVVNLAEAKAGDVGSKFPDKWVIGADTVVVIDGAILGKPGTTREAREILTRLSGRVHQVYTGFAILNETRGKLISKAVKTDVRFKELADEEIQWYVHTPEPFDKAGAYAIQGMGTFLVRSINGSYTNVVGLPVCEVIEILIKEGVVGFKKDGESVETVGR
jgi:septum formation protein